jgi:hypothetical protein
MDPMTIGQFGEVGPIRWLLDLPPGRVLDRVEQAAQEERLGARVEGHGFRLVVRSIVRNRARPGSGEKDCIGKGERREWSYTLTLQWDDRQTSRCEVLKLERGVFLRIVEHHGEAIGRAEFKLGPEAKLLARPEKAAR